MCYLRNLERITSKDGFPFYPSSHLSAALVLEDRPTIVTNHPCKKTETGECRKFNLSICHLESNERNNIGQPGSFIVSVETNRSQGTRKQISKNHKRAFFRRSVQLHIYSCLTFFGLVSIFACLLSKVCKSYCIVPPTNHICPSPDASHCEYVHSTIFKVAPISRYILELHHEIRTQSIYIVIRI